jgi:hypothetical protein
MRHAVSLFAMLAVVGSAAGVQSETVTVAKEVTQLAAEIQEKVVSRSEGDIRVQARGCWLHIEFGSHNAAFDLPLQGTQVSKTDMEDGIILLNSNMTRTISGRGSEVFESLILRFKRHNVNPVTETFENAIRACGIPRETSTADRGSRA